MDSHPSHTDENPLSRTPNTRQYHKPPLFVFSTDFRSSKIPEKPWYRQGASLMVSRRGELMSRASAIESSAALHHAYHLTSMLEQRLVGHAVLARKVGYTAQKGQPVSVVLQFTITHSYGHLRQGKIAEMASHQPESCEVYISMYFCLYHVTLRLDIAAIPVLTI